MFGPIARHRSVIVTLALVIVGFVLIGVAHTFHVEWAKVQVDRLVAEVGALLLVVGFLHWLFEIGLRKEMLREVSSTIVGHTLLHDSGLDSCRMDARQVDDRDHWSRSATLTVGRHYSPKFFKDFYEALRSRCAGRLPTTVLLLRADGAATRYLQESKTGNPTVSDSVAEIASLIGQIDAGEKRLIRVLFHDRVLRYSFIQTDEFIWIKFFANSPERATVPAFKVRAGTPLFEFFSNDIKRLVEHSSEA